MSHLRAVVRLYGLLLLLIPLVANVSLAQVETASVSGQVSDPTGLSISGALVSLVDIDRNTTVSTKTNLSGLYTFASIHPGRYRMQIRADGFRLINFTGLIVNVQDHLEQNFKLAVGSVSQSVTVESTALSIDKESPAVSTVVDRNFAENLPMNGRSFQTLIQLTPGVVLTANNGLDTGQFSVNGQRASSNYWMVDGVSANIGISATAVSGNGLGGAIGSTSVLGGTNSLVSVDAMQEFRIETSTFAPEFGRTPGGQISIVTRSGTNQFHGTAFDYLRNDALDANDWFNGINILNPAALPKAKERQNDFGGAVGGPILKNKTFFFFSYEGLRLRLPQTALTFVPDASFTPGTTNSRLNASPALQPYFNAYPLPNPSSPEYSPGGVASGAAAFNASFSVPATLDAYSLRIDHRLNDRLNVFGRYDYSPSSLTGRGTNALSSFSPTRVNTLTGTLGVNWAITNLLINDFRFNYSSTDASTTEGLDNFGGAVPLAALPLPSPFTSRNGNLFFEIATLGSNGGFGSGLFGHNHQHQLNFVDTVSAQKGPHSLKFGVDFRRLTPQVQNATYSQTALFSDVPSASSGNSLFNSINYLLPTNFLFRNLGVFAQDTWRVNPRLTLTYGLRWDTDFVPRTLSGPNFPAVVGFDLANLANLALAPAGTPPYQATYGNIAPRLGIAYQASQNPRWQTVIRGGFGKFYDLATSEVGNLLPTSLPSYPFGSTSNPSGTFPLTGSAANPAPIMPPDASNPGSLFFFDPKLRSPYTLQWNAAIEQSLGTEQTITASYIGAAGKHLLQTAQISPVNQDLILGSVVTNFGTSDYDALQLQFQRQMSSGLQVLASYTWSHSIDTASAGSVGNASNLATELGANINRGPSDFDIRNAVSAGLTYDMPFHSRNPIADVTLRGWSLDSVVQARSAPPVDVHYSLFSSLSSGFLTNVRPDIVAGQPFYLYAGQFPGGKAFNPNAFTSPPLDPTTSLPTSQGDLGRNALRGFGMFQWDFAVHRDFPIHESLKVQFRAEFFNFLNHPNFGPPSGDLSFPGALPPQFGLSTAMLGQSLAGGTGNLGSGAFHSLYQLGGPRSVQAALKLFF